MIPATKEVLEAIGLIKNSNPNSMNVLMDWLQAILLDHYRKIATVDDDKVLRRSQGAIAEIENVFNILKNHSVLLSRFTENSKETPF